MAWNLALAAIAFVFIVAALLAFISPRRQPSVGPLEGYLLAGGNLGRVSVINLLFSSSFGLNALFYQVWLGFTVGAWGLLIQAAWSLGFVLLARHATTVTAYKGLHDFLGIRFGFATRTIAAALSIVGMIYLMGWEIGIGTHTFAGLLESAHAPGEAVAASAWLTGSIALGCLFYTALGGLRGNAFANVLQNALKVIGFLFLAYLLYSAYSGERMAAKPFLDALFPSLTTMEEKLGWGG